MKSENLKINSRIKSGDIRAKTEKSPKNENMEIFKNI